MRRIASDCIYRGCKIFMSRLFRARFLANIFSLLSVQCWLHLISISQACRLCLGSSSRRSCCVFLQGSRMNGLRHIPTNGTTVTLAQRLPSCSFNALNCVLKRFVGISTIKQIFYETVLHDLIIILYIIRKEDLILSRLIFLGVCFFSDAYGTN